MRNIIAQQDAVCKVLREEIFDFLPKVAKKHISGVVNSFSQKYSHARTVDIAEFTGVYRTSVGHFLRNGKWDEKQLDQVQKRMIVQSLMNHAKETNDPIYISIDDTVITKTKPSAKAKRPFEKADWHFSHSEGKMVYGYQLVGIHMASGDQQTCYDLSRYEKGTRTKMEMCEDTLHDIAEKCAEYTELARKVYVLMDSWYTNANILHICKESHFTMIGAMKTNRILYPNGQKTSAAQYAASLTRAHFHPITVKGHTYLVHRYEGSLNKIDHAVVLLTYPEGKFGEKQSLRAYLCSDSDLSDEEILEHYSHRWKIEIMFRNCKSTLGIKYFMVHTVKAIDRLLILAIFTQFCAFCKFALV